VLYESGVVASRATTALGRTWHRRRHTEQNSTERPFLRVATELTGEDSHPSCALWWANVLHSGAVYPKHTHDGKWSFVYHLTEGAAIYFEDGESFRATPGQVLVFASTLSHWTDKVVGDAPRVSIAGNLHFRR
jgi:hypothetical protein